MVMRVLNMDKIKRFDFSWGLNTPHHSLMLDISKNLEHQYANLEVAVGFRSCGGWWSLFMVIYYVAYK